MMGIISIIIIVPSFSHLFFHHFLFPRGSTLPKKNTKNAPQIAEAASLWPSKSSNQDGTP